MLNGTVRCCGFLDDDNLNSYSGRKDEPGKYSAAKAGFISGIDVFDPLEFGISVKEAQYMDPSVRMSLEVSHEVRYPLSPNILPLIIRLCV